MSAWTGGVRTLSLLSKHVGHLGVHLFNKAGGHGARLHAPNSSALGTSSLGEESSRAVGNIALTLHAPVEAREIHSFTPGGHDGLSPWLYSKQRRAYRTNKDVSCK